MDTLFVDTHYFVAIINRLDQWHVTATDYAQQISKTRLVTTDCIFVETLNYFAEYKPALKERAADTIKKFSLSPRIHVVEQNSQLLAEGIHLYLSRLDKGYSLTDCISMNVARTFGISKILTHDEHFRQEGFEILL
ncbi:MAG TPA: PIN domain-containing protein [Pyrinomonadaceae bacterium]|nr:PIN domain-containing protein [Pyrinomonadaceae bacterium]